MSILIAAFAILIWALCQRRRRQCARTSTTPAGARRHHEVQAQLAHANRLAALGQLAASIAHEVSQPIAATVANAQAAMNWLSAEPPDLSEVRQALDWIIKDCARAADIVSRIRTMTQKAPARIGDVALNEAILEVIAMTRGEAAKGGLSVRTDFAAGLPAVRGDRVQLQQVVLNLIINAIEAMSGLNVGTHGLQIRTEAAADDRVLVTVADTGVGLAPVSFARLFEPFHTTKANGLGLGLSICRSIVEAHGGRLRARPNAPRGAIFQFDLAIASPRAFSRVDPPEPAMAPARRVVYFNPQGHTMTTLKSPALSADNHLHPDHGYQGALPERGEHADPARSFDHVDNFHGNEMRDGHGHVGGGGRR
jgi:C4-dicarboxylate-specific signal transduction histidine kinase